MSEATRDHTGRRAEKNSFVVEALEIRDGGRVRIPHRLRDEYDIEENDVLDVDVVTRDHIFGVLDMIIDDEGRIRIPKRKRDLYGTHDGDTVTIEVTPTGMNAG